MAIAKVIYKSSPSDTGTTWMDVTSKTVTAASMRNGVTALKNDGTDITGNIADMTLPTAASASSSGTQKAEITPGSSVQYINIPTGYNGSAAYYKINATTGGGMNIQAALGMVTKANQAYEATDLSIKVAKTGTYTVSWDGCRSSTSGTNGSRIYINGTAQTAYTTFDATNTRWQHVEMTNVSLNANDVVTLWCRARGTSYYMTVGDLIIVQTA